MSPEPALREENHVGVQIVGEDDPFLRALSMQTDQIARAVERLGDRFDRGVESLRAGQEEVRNSIIKIAILALVLMAAATGIGISIRPGGITVTPKSDHQTLEQP